MKQKNSIKNIQEFICDNFEAIINQAKSGFNTPTSKTVGELTHIVEEIIQKKDRIINAFKISKKACYIFDTANLTESIKSFQSAFKKHVPDAVHYYAVKLNHYHDAMKQIFSSGFNADVSSARELFLAKEAGATKFLFSGPGKTKEELSSAICSGLDVTINIDNFSELNRLKLIAHNSNHIIKVGVRITFEEHGSWGKFGIPLTELSNFFTLCKEEKNISLQGIQFHMSWNQDGEPFRIAIKKLAQYLKKSELSELVSDLKYIDIGGGFRPYLSEGYFPEDTSEGRIIESINQNLGEKTEFNYPYILLDSVPIEEYAKAIGESIDTYLRPLKEFEYYTEPGRIIVNSAFHIATKVVDVKSDSCVITDGGTNIVGFERFEFDYFPLVNISNPYQTNGELKETECGVYGSLCMPQDYWGLRIYSGKISEDDIIIVPYQGALTYANMNDFIKGRAEVVQI